MLCHAPLEPPHPVTTRAGPKRRQSPIGAGSRGRSSTRALERAAICNYAAELATARHGALRLCALCGCRTGSVRHTAWESWRLAWKLLIGLHRARLTAESPRCIDADQ